MSSGHANRSAPDVFAEFQGVDLSTVNAQFMRDGAAGVSPDAAREQAAELPREGSNVDMLPRGLSQLLDQSLQVNNLGGTTSDVPRGLSKLYAEVGASGPSGAGGARGRGTGGTGQISTADGDVILSGTATALQGNPPAFLQSSWLDPAAAAARMQGTTLQGARELESAHRQQQQRRGFGVIGGGNLGNPSIRDSGDSLPTDPDPSQGLFSSLPWITQGLLTSSGPSGGAMPLPQQQQQYPLPPNPPLSNRSAAFKPSPGVGMAHSGASVASGASDGAQGNSSGVSYAQGVPKAMQDFSDLDAGDDSDGGYSNSLQNRPATKAGGRQPKYSEEERRKRRAASNRLSAERSREKRRSYITGLELGIKNLQAENCDLRVVYGAYRAHASKMTEIIRAGGSQTQQVAQLEASERILKQALESVRRNGAGPP